MYTTKRFTPTVLRRFETQGRGSGTGADFLPWHRVSRSDPPSHGRSHLLPVGSERHWELLSDSERTPALFATLTPRIEDLREQFPLSLETSIHELSDYDVRYSGVLAPGTIEIARQLGIRHPVVRENGTTTPWRMTTDLVPVFRTTKGRSMLAIASKPDATLSKRETELLEIDREYWRVRRVGWLLVTPRQYDAHVADLLSRAWPWALLLPPAPLGAKMLEAILHREGEPLSRLLNWLARQLGDMGTAQAAFWQAVWKHEILLDLRRGWRPHEPIWLLPPADFHALNPLESRRSEWT